MGLWLLVICLFLHTSLLPGYNFVIKSSLFELLESSSHQGQCLCVFTLFFFSIFTNASLFQGVISSLESSLLELLESSLSLGLVFVCHYVAFFFFYVLLMLLFFQSDFIVRVVAIGVIGVFVARVGVCVSLYCFSFFSFSRCGFSNVHSSSCRIVVRHVLSRSLVISFC